MVQGQPVFCDMQYILDKKCDAPYFIDIIMRRDFMDLINELTKNFQETAKACDDKFTLGRGNGKLTGSFNDEEKLWQVDGKDISFKVYVEDVNSAIRLTSEEAARRIARAQQKLEAA
jgi:hypothetical protein